MDVTYYFYHLAQGVPDTVDCNQPVGREVSVGIFNLILFIYPNITTIGVSMGYHRLPTIRS